MDTHVAVLPLYQILEPYILALWAALVPLLMTWALAQFQARTGIRVNEHARTVIQQAAVNAAGRVLAAQEGKIADLSFDVHHPAVAAEVPKVQAAVGDALDRLGVTPDRVADLIVGKIGLAQAGLASGPAVVAAPQSGAA